MKDQARRPPPTGGGDGGWLLSAALESARSRLREACGRLGDAEPRDVHHARVAARRLRAMLSVFAPVLEVDEPRSIRRDLRRLARRLEPVREADVRRALLLDLASGVDDLSAADRARLRRLLDASCASARRDLRRALARAGWLARLRALVGEGAPLAAVAPRAAGARDILQLAHRPWRKLRHRCRARPRTRDDLHRLRLALKHGRYALEAVAAVDPGSSGAVLDRLRSAQDGLGEHRDTLEVSDWVRSSEAALGRPAARALRRALRLRERTLRDVAAARAMEVQPAYSRWREATRALRSTAAATRVPASRAGAHPSRVRA
jgi:CHAD domain-containing protein